MILRNPSAVITLLAALDVLTVASAAIDTKSPRVTAYGIDENTDSFVKFSLANTGDGHKIAVWDDPDMQGGTEKTWSGAGTAAYPADSFVYVLERDIDTKEPRKFLKVSKDNGAILKVLPLPGVPTSGQFWGDIAMNLATGDLFGLAQTPGFFGCKSPTTIAKIDPNTGTVTKIGDIHGNVDALCGAGIAIDKDGVGYGFASWSGDIYSVNMVTAEAILVATGDAHGERKNWEAGLAYEPITDKVYFASTDFEETFLEVLDTTTGRKELVGTVHELEDARGLYSWLAFGLNPDSPLSCDIAHYGTGCCSTTCQRDVHAANPALNCLTHWSHACVEKACGSSGLCGADTCGGICYPDDADSRRVVAYGVDETLDAFVKFNLANPENAHEIKDWDTPDQLSSFSSAGTAAYPTDSFIYVLDQDNDTKEPSTFAKVSKQNGEIEQRLPLPMPPNAGQLWADIAFDLSTGDMYGLATTPGWFGCRTPTTIAKIDPDTGAVAKIGDVSGATDSICTAGLGIDKRGVGYAYDFWSGKFYSVDLATAVTTLIDDTPDLTADGYRQDMQYGMGYEPITDSMYVLSIDASSQDSSLHVTKVDVINTFTGEKASVGNVKKIDSVFSVWAFVAFGLDPDTPKSCDIAHYDTGCCLEVCQDAVHNSRPDLDCMLHWSHDCVEAACGSEGLCNADACEGTCTYQDLTYDTSTNVLGLTNSNVKVSLAHLVNDDTDELQELQFDKQTNQLSLTKSGAVVDLSPFYNPPQKLNFDPNTKMLDISGPSSKVDLSFLVQDLSFNTVTNEIEISAGGKAADVSSLRVVMLQASIDDINGIDMAAGRRHLDENDFIGYYQNRDLSGSNEDGPPVVEYGGVGTLGWAMMTGGRLIGYSVAANAKLSSGDLEVGLVNCTDLDAPSPLGSLADVLVLESGQGRTKAKEFATPISVNAGDIICFDAVRVGAVTSSDNRNAASVVLLLEQ